MAACHEWWRVALVLVLAGISSTTVARGTPLARELPEALIEWGTAVTEPALESRVVSHASHLDKGHHRGHRHRRGHPKHLALGSKRLKSHHGHRRVRHHNQTVRLHAHNRTGGKHTTSKKVRGRSGAVVVPKARQRNHTAAMHKVTHSSPAPLEAVDDITELQPEPEAQPLPSENFGRQVPPEHGVGQKSSTNPVTSRGRSHGQTASMTAVSRTNQYAAATAPQVVLDKEQKIADLEERNGKIVSDFHKLDLAYRDTQNQAAALRRRFENDQDTLQRRTKMLQVSFSKVKDAEAEREKLVKENKERDLDIAKADANNERLLHVLELKNRAETSLRKQLTVLRTKVNDDLRVQTASETTLKQQEQNSTHQLEMSEARGKELRQRLKVLQLSMKAQEVDKAHLAEQRRLLTEENSRLTSRNERLDRLEAEHTAQMKTLQSEVRDDRTERDELQQEMDTLESGGGPQPSMSSNTTVLKASAKKP